MKQIPILLTRFKEKSFKIREIVLHDRAITFIFKNQGCADSFVKFIKNKKWYNNWDVFKGSCDRVTLEIEETE